MKTKQTDKSKQPQKAAAPAAKPVVKQAAKSSEKDREKPKQPNRVVRWWRETVGELRKVAWPTMQETRRLTGIVLIVMFLMSAVLGLLDWVFSKLISLLVA
jgi:preprotein translocase subunit SecE